MIEQRPGKKQHIVPDPSWGVQVVEPGPQAAAGGGWWDDFGGIGCCIGAWQGRAATNYAASLIDLSGNGNNLAEIGGGPVNWDAVNGWSGFVALARCLDTGLNPNPGSWSMLVQYTIAANGQVVMGCQGAGASRFYLQPVWAGGAAHIYASGTTAAVAPIMPNGNMGLSGQGGYLNGVWEANCGWWGALPGCSVYIGALNNAGAPGLWTTANVQAACLYNCLLNVGEMAAVAAWMAAL